MTKTLIAKPVVKDKFWVVTDGTARVGNIVARSEGYDLKLNSGIEHFKNTAAIKKQRHIDFTNIKSQTVSSPAPFKEYPTPKRIYNSMFDLQKRVHVFTKSIDSKCYYVAGWFKFLDNEELDIQFCHKYLFIQRYKYIGPFISVNDIEK